MSDRQRPQHDYGGWIAREEEEWQQFALLHPIILEGKHAVMSFETFDKLDEYSTTMPTGAIIGKRWKRREATVGCVAWFLGTYGPHENPDRVTIGWYDIYIREANEIPRRATAQLIETIHAARGTVAALR